MNNKFKRIDYNYEDKMVSNIENALNGEFIIEMLKKVGIENMIYIQ